MCVGLIIGATGGEREDMSENMSCQKINVAIASSLGCPLVSLVICLDRLAHSKNTFPTL